MLPCGMEATSPVFNILAYPDGQGPGLKLVHRKVVVEGILRSSRGIDSMRTR
jgi:hypothetical protein